MKDYNLIIAEIAASIVTDCLGESLTANTYYSADGNFIIMAFSGYPLRGSDRTGNVYVQFPRNTFYKKRGNVHFTPIYQSRCRYYQETFCYNAWHREQFRSICSKRIIRKHSC